jgi:hypothetical protein
MSVRSSKSKRRAGVLLNYGALLLLVGVFAIGQRSAWPGLVVAGLAATAVLLVASFVKIHLRTRLWRLVHARVEDLDERQYQITLRALRYAYAIFTVTSLSVVFCLALTAEWNSSLLMLVLASLLYLAHTLPSSVLAWTEREV